MAVANSTEIPLINGHYPLTANDIECTGHITHEQAVAMGAMFRSIARLTKDREIIALCSHGALQADLQANDIDCQTERAVKAGTYNA